MATIKDIDAEIARKRNATLSDIDGEITSRDQIDARPLRNTIESNQINSAIDALVKKPPAKVAAFPTAESQARELRDVLARDKANRILTQKGFTQPQIDTFVAIQRGMKPSIGKTLRREAGQTVGGIAGAAAGVKLAAVLGQIPPFTVLPEEAVTVPLFASLGAFFGGSGGKMTQQAIDPFEDVSIMEALKAGIEEAAFEGIGRGVGLGFKAAFVGKQLPDAQRGAELFARHGGFFTPAQRGATTLTESAEALSRGSFGGGPIFEGFDQLMQARAIEASQEITQRIARDTLKDPALLTKELAEIFTRPGGSRVTLLDEFADIVYAQVDELAPNARLNPFPIKEFAEQAIAQNKRSQFLSKEGLSEFKKILELPDDMTFKEVRQKASSLKKLSRKFGVDADISEGKIKQLASKFDDMMFEPANATDLPEPARRLLRNINAVYGAGKELYEDSFIKAIAGRLKDAPSGTIDAFFKDMDPSRIKNMRESLVSPVRKVSGVGTAEKNISKELRQVRRSIKGTPAERLLAKNVAEGKSAWRQLKATWLANQINKATTKGGTIDGLKLAKLIDDLPVETRKIMFPGGEWAGIKEIESIFKTISPKKGGLSTLFGKGIEFGAGSGLGRSLMTGNGIGIATNGALIISPWTFAKIATSKKGAKLLSTGLKLQAKGKNIAPFAIRLGNFLIRTDEETKMDIIREKRKLEAFRQRKREEERITEFRGVPGRKF